MYKLWSTISNAQDLSEFLGKNKDGESGFKPIREPTSMKNVSNHTAKFILSATRLVLEKYRPGEQDYFLRWYAENVEKNYTLFTGRQEN